MQFVNMEYAHWEHLPIEAQPAWALDMKGIVALDDNNVMVAASIMDSWSHNSCRIHIWVAKPMVFKHGFAQETFNYIFNTCGKGVVVGVTPADNEKALKFIKHIGLKEVTRIPDGYAEGVDYVVTQLRKEDCRWIEQPPRLNVVGGN